MPKETTEKHVLLIEDDVFIQKAYQLKFGKNGIQTKVLNDGKAALEYIENASSEKPNAVMLDLMLPFVSGFEILEKIRITKGWETIPVIILSNLSQESDIEKAKKLGAKEFLVKADVKIDDVIKKVKEYL